ncbi:hypothetical protein ACIHDR_46280 [Nocardia sp. NPDC052278]|uniref:hypothetical protein n=1 Tax=unclassified Nocardia TaxID=2637762 RepID=UPI00369495EB
MPVAARLPVRLRQLMFQPERKIDPDDRRARLVVLTTEGHAALGVAAEQIIRIERKLVATLSGRGWLSCGNR